MTQKCPYCNRPIEVILAPNPQNIPSPLTHEPNKPTIYTETKCKTCGKPLKDNRYYYCYDCYQLWKKRQAEGDKDSHPSKQ